MNPDVLQPSSEASAPASPSVQKPSWRVKTAKLLLELLQVAAVSIVLIVLPVRYFLVQPFYVKGASMEPNFQDHEYLIIDEISYRFEAPQRGEIVVFRPPVDQDQYFIKRVIGLPGETVEITNGKITIYNKAYPTGRILDESAYLEAPFSGDMRPVTMKEGEYFLMGDNRDASFDSRGFGPVKKEALVGRVWIRGYPIHRWTVFHKPPVYNQL